MNRGKKEKTIIMVIVFVLALIGIAVLIGNLSSLVIKDEFEVTGEKSTFTDMNTIYIDGEGYLRKNYVKTYMILGLDKSGKLEYSELSFNQGNQADFILLFVFNENDGSYNLLHINRDTMADVKKLGKFGDEFSTEKMQICLSHAYGDGKQISCQNTADAVSNLLYGVEIDRYISASMSAVQEVNDFVGGVPVEIREDLTSIDPSMTVGAKVTLFGEKALSFVRGRKGVGDQTNIERMSRQQQYISSMADQVKLCNKTEDDFVNLFNGLSDYVISDFGIDDFNKIFKAVKSGENKGLITPEGETIFNKEHIEFHVNEDNLKSIVKELFFDKIEK